MANYALRVPESLFAYARQVAAEEQVSMNQFFVTAIAEKVSALKTETFFETARPKVKPLTLMLGWRSALASLPWKAMSFLRLESSLSCALKPGRSSTQTLKPKP